MQYETMAEAYRDLEQASGRLALTARLAGLLAATPDGLLPTVCYLCQGLIAPEFAGIDLGLAEKLAVRAVATATGRTAAEVAARCGRPATSARPPNGCCWPGPGPGLRPGPGPGLRPGPGAGPRPGPGPGLSGRAP